MIATRDGGDGSQLHGAEALEAMAEGAAGSTESWVQGPVPCCQCGPQKCTEEETNNGTPIISHISDKKTLKKSKIVFLEAFFFGSLYKALLQKKLNRDICLQESFPASVLVLLRQFAAVQVFLNAVHHFPSLTVSLL